MYIQANVTDLLSQWTAILVQLSFFSRAVVLLCAVLPYVFFTTLKPFQLHVFLVTSGVR